MIKVASSVARQLDGSIHFTFKDAFGNVISVPLTQEQLNDYYDTLGMFVTDPS